MQRLGKEEEVEVEVEDILELDMREGGTSTTSQKNTSIFYFSYMKWKIHFFLQKKSFVSSLLFCAML